MHLQQYLHPEAILTQVHASDKWDLIEQLIVAIMRAPIVQEHPHITQESIRSMIKEREEEATAVLDCGLAFPHLRLDDFTGIGLAFAILDKPTPMNGQGQDPVSLGCLMLIPSEHPTVGLKVMAQLARLMLDEKAKSSLLNCASPENALDVLRPIFETDDVIKARDIMRAPKYAVYVDTPLRHVTRKIVHHSVEAVGVVDHDHHLKGQITCDDLFRFGLPEYFGHLKTVSFIRTFNPFDKYFAGENMALAADVMNANYSTVALDTTLLEIIFLFSVKKYPKVYVVEEGKLVGIIDRRLVLDRVINF